MVVPDTTTGTGFDEAIHRTRDGELDAPAATPTLDSAIEFEAGLEALILSSVRDVPPDQLEATLESYAEQLADATE